MKTKLAILIAGLFAMNSYAALHTETIEYKQGDTTCEGYLAYDDAVKGLRPGVLVVHDWLGLDSYPKMRADMLAKLGYVAFAADIYGKGVRPKGPEEAMAQVKVYKGDRVLLRARVNAALDALKKQPQGPASDVAALQDELRAAGVDWQMIYYSGAVHAFTRPDAGSDNSKGAAYKEHADKRSWEAMKEFFAEIF